METMAQPEVETVLEAPRAGVLLHPLRQEVLREAREPSSSTEMLQDRAFRLCFPRLHVRSQVRLPIILSRRSEDADSEGAEQHQKRRNNRGVGAPSSPFRFDARTKSC